MAYPTSILDPYPTDFIGSLVNGTYWYFAGGERVINWSLSDGWDGSYWSNPDKMMGYIDAMFDDIEQFINVTFNYVGYFNDPGNAYYGGSDINYAWSFSEDRFPSEYIWAGSNFPLIQWETEYAGQSGDVFLNGHSGANDLDYSVGGTGYALLLHETGHSLGLKHPHDDGGTGRPTYTDLGYSNFDIEYISVMSYEETYGWDYFTYEPASFMLFDVVGLQYLYGENTTLTSGDTNWQVWDDGSHWSLYDAGGRDSIELLDGWTVNLYEGWMESNNSGAVMWIMGNIEVSVGRSTGTTIIMRVF